MAEMGELQVPTFTFFPRLPTEIRLLIWKHALEDQDVPAVCFFRPGCWHLNRLPEDDKDYKANTPYVVDFRYDMIGVPLKMSLLRVNDEVHQAALQWIREPTGKHPAQGRWTVVRAMGPTRDTLYLAQAGLYDFLKEAAEVIHSGLDRLLPSEDYARLFVQRIAVLEKDCFSPMVQVLFALPVFTSLTTVKIICNILPNSRRQWKMGPPICLYIWSRINADFVWHDVGPRLQCRNIKSRIETFAKELKPRLHRQDIQSFEFQLVAAVPT